MSAGAGVRLPPARRRAVLYGIWPSGGRKSVKPRGRGQPPKSPHGCSQRPRIPQAGGRSAGPTRVRAKRQGPASAHDPNWEQMAAPIFSTGCFHLLRSVDEVVGTAGNHVTAPQRRHASQHLRAHRTIDRALEVAHDLGDAYGVPDPHRVGQQGQGAHLVPFPSSLELDLPRRGRIGQGHGRTEAASLIGRALIRRRRRR